MHEAVVEAHLEERLREALAPGAVIARRQRVELASRAGTPWSARARLECDGIHAREAHALDAGEVGAEARVVARPRATGWSARRCRATKCAQVPDAAPRGARSGAAPRRRANASRIAPSRIARVAHVGAQHLHRDLGAVGSRARCTCATLAAATGSRRTRRSALRAARPARPRRCAARGAIENGGRRSCRRRSSSIVSGSSRSGAARHHLSQLDRTSRRAASSPRAGAARAAAPPPRAAARGRGRAWRSGRARTRKRTRGPPDR